MLIQIALAAVLGASAHADNFGDCVRNNAGARVCAGQRVVTTSNQLATVRNVFNNGTIIVLRDGYSSTDQYSVDNLSPEVRCYAQPEGSICKQSVVITSSNQTGKALYAFANGKIQVLRDGYSSPDVYSASNVSPEVQSYGELYAQARVITSSNQTGTALKVFANGKTQVQRDGYSSPDVYSASNLAAEVSNYGEIYKNGKVITSSNQTGTALEVFSNGKVKVQRDGYSSPDVYSASNLSAQSRGPRNPGQGPGQGPGRHPRGPGRYPRDGRQEDTIIRKGDRVITSSNQVGTVLLTFSNDKSQVQRDGYSSPDFYTTSSLGKGMQWFEGFAPGQKVITTSNQTGTIREVFSNGRALVQRDGYSSPDVYSLSSLSN